MKIVKRRGHVEPYDERKLYASVYAACRAAGLSEEIAEEVAQRIAEEATQWMHKGQVASTELFRNTAYRLRQHHKGAALLYETHLDIS